MTADLQHAAGARLDDPQLLVLAGGGQQGAVPVQGHAEDHLRVTVDGVDHRALADVPHDYLKKNGVGWSMSCYNERGENGKGRLYPYYKVMDNSHIVAPTVGTLLWSFSCSWRTKHVETGVKLRTCERIAVEYRALPGSLHIKWRNYLNIGICMADCSEFVVLRTA